MADNIDVSPSEESIAVAVATDEQTQSDNSKIHIPIYEDLNLAIPQGKIASVSSVNKYGYAPDGVQTTKTDIWDRADAAATQIIWTAPVAAPVLDGVFHDIVSTSAVDDGSPESVGARQIQIYGLPDWDTKEISEVITMNGTTNVRTVNKYVIIHRMKVISYGVLGPNVGVITATNAAGTVVTAQINSTEGQTQMAIYGIPSVQDAYLNNWYASMHRSKTDTINIKLLYCTDPVNAGSQFITKETRGLVSTGTSSATWEKKPYTKFTGPGILKVQGTGSLNDIDCGAGFDLILVDK